MAQIEMRCVGLASLLFLAVVSVGANQLSEYRKQEAFLKQYPCGDPQPRIFELGEVIGEDVLKETTHGFTLSIKPAVTVLHRCYSSGCCQNAGERCMPFATEDVKLTFVVAGRTLDFLEVEAVNHTQCACARA